MDAPLSDEQTTTIGERIAKAFRFKSTKSTPAAAGTRMLYSDSNSGSISSYSTVKHVIVASERRKGNVTGLTAHGDELFILRQWSKGFIEVYNATNFKFERNIRVKEFEEVEYGLFRISFNGLALCVINNCLYVSYENVTNGHIVKVELAGDNEVVEWKVKDECEPLGLSVNSEHNLIVATGEKRQSPPRLIEYTTRGELVREIRLIGDIARPSHAIQLNRSQFLVSHRHAGRRSSDRVCVVNAKGRVLVKNSKTGRLFASRQLAVDRNGFIIVLDCLNNRIAVLDSALKWSRDLRIDLKGGGVKRPWSLYLDERRKLLFVGELNGDDSRVVVVTA